MTASSDGRFSFAHWAVPPFPASQNWVDHLRWVVSVMDHGDDDLGFTASLLGHAAQRGGLTDKQAKYGRRVVERVRALWLAGQLQCQRVPIVPPSDDDRNVLADAMPEGRA